MRERLYGIRKRIYEIIEASDGDDRISRVYDIFMILTITVSLIPLCFKEQTRLLRTMDHVTCSIFVFDYILRLATADMKLKRGKASFLRYPFTPMAIIDLISIMPSIVPVHSHFRLLKILRVARTAKAFRAFKAFRYSKNITIIIRVFRREKDALLVVCGLAAGYIIVTALMIFNAEPSTFPTFFDALYWATISLTTVGYGDIYATSAIGRVITMISSVFGIAVVALPAGILTAGYMEELKERTAQREKDEAGTGEG